MTRKDYILIAKAINKAVNKDIDNKGIYDIVEALAVSLKEDNQNFKREVFIKACYA